MTKKVKRGTKKGKKRAESTPRRKRLDVGPVIYLGLMVVVMFGLAMAVYFGS